MRVKKQKRHRRAVRFYTACFGFRQPYKVLCDGTFIHHLIVNNIAPADTAISNILGGSVKLFTTRSAPFCFSFSLCSKIRRKIGFLFVCCCFWGCRCVLAELKRLGKSYTESLQAANTLMIARWVFMVSKGLIFWGFVAEFDGLVDF
jgi:U3 small nucleolar RNA-associated protein 23